MSRNHINIAIGSDIMDLSMTFKHFATLETTERTFEEP